MSSRVFQSVIVQMKEATDRVIGVIDADSNVISCSDTSLIGEKWPEAVIKLNSAPDSVVVVDKKTFKPLVSWSAYFDYAVFAEGDDETARSLCVMAYVALNGAKTYYEEKHDKGTFVKNIITDNILPGDIYIRAKELHFVTDAPRAVFLVRQVGRADVASVDVLSGMFPDKQQDFVLSINETDIAIVKQLAPGTEKAELLQTAQTIEQTLRSELFVKTVIGISTVAGHLRELADAYKEAQVAIPFGMAFLHGCAEGREKPSGSTDWISRRVNAAILRFAQNQKENPVGTEAAKPPEYSPRLHPATERLPSQAMSLR